MKKVPVHRVISSLISTRAASVSASGSGTGCANSVACQARELFTLRPSVIGWACVKVGGGQSNGLLGAARRRGASGAVASGVGVNLRPRRRSESWDLDCLCNRVELILTKKQVDAVLRSRDG